MSKNYYMNRMVIEKEEREFLSIVDEHMLKYDLSRIGVTETTGGSEMHENEWIEYKNDPGITLWVKEITNWNEFGDFLSGKFCENPYNVSEMLIPLSIFGSIAVNQATDK